MKKILPLLALASILFSCNNDKADDGNKDKDNTTGTNDKEHSKNVNLPYTASYSSSFNDNVSDDDLKLVLQTYKDWADGNLNGLMQSISDSISVEFADGGHFKGTRDSLTGIWTKFRDSLSSVVIDMEAWHKMYSTDKKDSYIVTWYKETDTYKTGKVDSARYHDINQVKDGKIIWYSQYRRVAK